MAQSLTRGLKGIRSLVIFFFLLYTLHFSEPDEPDTPHHIMIINNNGDRINPYLTSSITMDIMIIACKPERRLYAPTPESEL